MIAEDVKLEAGIQHGPLYKFARDKAEYVEVFVVLFTVE